MVDKPTPGGDETRAAEIASLLADDLRGKTPEGLELLVRVIDGHLEALHLDERGAIRELDTAEQAAFDGLMALRQRAMDRLEEHRRVAEVLRRRPPAVERVLTSLGAEETPATAIRRMRPQELRDAALRRLDDRHDTSHLSAPQKDQVERAIRRDTAIATRVLVTEMPEYRSAWMKLMTRDRPIFTPEEERAVLAWEEYRAMAESGGSTGGYGVPAFIDPSIILTAQESGNPFLAIARQVNLTNSNEWKGVSSAGVSWTFQTEGAAANDASPTLAQPTVRVHTARGFIPFSIEVGEDYPAFADEMSRLLAAGYDELLVEKFTTGSGSGEPFGILTALSSNTNVRVAVTTAGVNFSAGDPYKVWKALPERHRRRASWLMNVGVNNAIRQLGTADVYHASTVNLPESWAEVLFGRPVYESPHMPDVTTSTSSTDGLAIVGDFENFVIARRGGMTVEYIPHLVQQVTAGEGPAVPTGQRGWFAHARIGSDSVNDLAFRLLVNTG